jgi:transposase
VPSLHIRRFQTERQELAQLRRQLRQVTQERDILAKATAWFANKDSAIDKTSMR